MAARHLSHWRRARLKSGPRSPERLAFLLKIPYPAELTVHRSLRQSNQVSAATSTALISFLLALHQR
jgi:hypothetical protein